MAEDRKEQLNDLAERLKQAESYLQLDTKRKELDSLDEATSQPGFWDDTSKAQELSRQASVLRNALAQYEKAESLLADAQAAYELEMDEDALQSEAELDLLLSEIELSSWFDGEYDHGDAIVSVNPGQGGLEAQDWAHMLYKMYLRYAQGKKFKVEVLDVPSGDVVGIDSATFIVSGPDAYGLLRAESGTHRLVRISPTDEKKRRHTTFAGVEVLPVLPDDLEVQINDGDLRIDVFRSSGPGGQSVNTTDSAVRITHIPTGTVVSCQNEKSQLQNKESAMKILRSRLFELERARREAEISALRGDRVEAAWGNQIRNYVLYPYQLIKDVRSGFETGNVTSVLEEGNLDPFIMAYHKWRLEQESNGN
ncbi:MAG: peptide chain release factor 2 [Coriobacteriales bacterium]|jgi:peptide chain release factor 2|nr:peptide chain release factor 2 [Coriobacteriales bacterium]